MRHIPEFPLKTRPEIIRKFLVCSAAGCAVYLLSPGKKSAENFAYLIILVLLSDIDILIRKIPTELLAAYYAVSAVIICRRSVPSVVILSALLPAAVLFAVRKKAGIALYDILLMIPLFMQCGSFGDQLRFAALFLIAWGIAGLSVRLLKKGRDPLTVPLVPAAVLSFLVLTRLISA